MAVDNDSIDCEDNQNDWTKMMNSAKNAGYREGADIGRESVFQEGFDLGYQQGFKNGFLFGICHGLSRVKCPQTLETNQLKHDTLSLITKPTIADCQICVNSELLNASIKEINSFQKEHHKKTELKLQLKYGNTAKNFGVHGFI